MYLAGFFALLVALLIPADLFLKSHLPLIDGEVQVPGLSSQVEIYRDRWGIPHLFAQNDEDLFKAYGYTVASDRLFQMELLRRVVNGELSDLIGEKEELLKADKMLRKLRLRKSADEYLELHEKDMDPHLLKILSSFVDGINFYVSTRPMPLELKLLGQKSMRPFQVAEIMGVAGYMGLSFAEGLIADPLKTSLLEEFSPEMVGELFIKENADTNQAVQNKTKVSLQSQWYKDIMIAMQEIDQTVGLFHGSNSWVLSPKRSKSGAALLANDPHIAFSNPSVWYEAHLHTPEWEVYGNFVPLAPFPAIGHDRNRAWAVTMAEVDDQDMYQEQVDFTQKTVLFKNAPVPLKIEQEIIKVKGAADVKIDVISTPHGPLVDDTDFGLKGKHLALKWAYHNPENHTLSAIYEMMKATKYDDFKKALAKGVTPALNVSWVDREGNIAWHIMAKIPVLPKGVDSTQVLDGASGKHEYLRYATFEENPHILNPDSGVIVTANYYPEYNPGKLTLQGYWQASERFERINKLLSEKELWDLDDLNEIQFDAYAQLYDYFKPVLLSSVTKKRNHLDEVALKKLREWDGVSRVNSIGSSIFYMWFYQITQHMLKDEMGADRLKAYGSVADMLHFMKWAITHPESKWWDDHTTMSEVESREVIVEKAFYEAIDALKIRLGNHIGSWKWGKLHTIEFEHLLGKKKPLNKIFNIGPLPAQGSFSHIDNMSYRRYEDSFDVKLGPSTRRLIDMAEPERSWGILPTGNSGLFNSPHFDDQTPLYLKGKYRRQLLDIADIKKSGFNLLKLKP
ncbi:MAG: hypothetical protein COV37_15305 [Bdellovibrio sp. CG11_big_fil_rev_8_21_14_0_20_39_38]|nr:MAG: hypothetical protein COW78_15425 [Bdellovibrio sp. CG22_combo_CG10-13_8_21_14_all_39_27]PIR33758.1 MAG: hypothetical protein COV37_15305 [Bdellovibrio sp. CG11_big_fil_rev_8_21_14_0_20_39_38]